MKKWRCKVCGFEHQGDSPPKQCPVCDAPASMFEEMG
ncbi:MAG TPA: rubrerythrin family protein [Deltaproteobacteria bacterium]|nr:rubrerythrin family protein [Deltaproteobacteria bacterium]